MSSTLIDDIEDLVKPGEDEPLQRLERNQIQILKTRNRKEEEPSGDNIPWTQKIWIHTWGCSHNNSDGEYMAGQLQEYGYKIVDHPDNAELWILNSCTVKNPSQDHFVNTIKDAQARNKKVVVSGCVPQAAPKMEEIKGLSIIGVQQIDRVVEVVEETLKGHTVRILGKKKEGKKKLGGARLDLPKIRKNPLVEIVPISTGCLNQCTYCKTKHARGDLASYPIEEIVARIKQVVEEGVKEIWLTSEDTGVYGRDIGTDITKLLWSILEVLPEPVMLRLGMTNPPYIKEHIEEMVKIYQHPRIYKYLHIPVQSGSNKVLSDMRREYTREDFEHIVEYLTEKIPGITIATDLIIGFPGETDEEFEETWSLVQKFKFNVLFVNQFYPRPGTPAAKMKRVPTSIVKQRTKKISNWFKSYMPWENRVGEKHKILITEEAPDGKHLAGRTEFYEMVLVEPDPNLMGKAVEVEIIDTGKFYLMGKVITDKQEFTEEGEKLPELFVNKKKQKLRQLTRKKEGEDVSNTKKTGIIESMKKMDKFFWIMFISSLVLILSSFVLFVPRS